MSRVEYLHTDHVDHLRQIVALQQRNLPEQLTRDEKQSDGFVSARHDIQLLEAFCRYHPQTIALLGEELVGYALIMHPALSDSIPLLQPLFQEIDKIFVDGSYYVMGQICVDSAYRKQGIFRGLYTAQWDYLSSQYDHCITEVDALNARSCRAHESVGFQTIHRYRSHHQDWLLIEKSLA